MWIWYQSFITFNRAKQRRHQIMLLWLFRMFWLFWLFWMFYNAHKPMLEGAKIYKFSSATYDLVFIIPVSASYQKSCSCSCTLHSTCMSWCKQAFMDHAVIALDRKNISSRVIRQDASMDYLYAYTSSRINKDTVNWCVRVAEMLLHLDPLRSCCCKWNSFTIDNHW